jgi:hypothetical protein
VVVPREDFALPSAALKLAAAPRRIDTGERAKHLMVKVSSHLALRLEVSRP